MTTKTKTYLEMISVPETPEEANATTAKEALHSLNGDIQATAGALNAAKAKLKAAQRAIPYSATAEVKAEVEVDGLQKGLERLKEIRETRFSDVKLD